MKKTYLLTVQQLFDAVQNTIRVFNEYALDKKMLPNNTYRINSGANFYLLQLFTMPEGTQLKVTAGKVFGKITEGAAVQLVNQFYSRLDLIVKGQIVLTPDVVNRDVYKAGQGAVAFLTLLKFIVALIAIAIALGILMR